MMRVWRSIASSVPVLVACARGRVVGEGEAMAQRG